MHPILPQFEFILNYQRGAADRTLILWDLFDLREAGRLYSVDISPDKQWALLGTRDSPSILLNLHSGQIKRASFGHRGRIEAIVFVVALHHALGSQPVGEENDDRRAPCIGRRDR